MLCVDCHSLLVMFLVGKRSCGGTWGLDTTQEYLFAIPGLDLAEVQWY